MRSAVFVHGALGLVLLMTANVTGASAGASTAQPHIVVTPAVGLRNGEIVKVRGAGFKPKDSVFIVECLATAKGQAQCNISTVVAVTINAKGLLPLTKFKVRTGKIGSGTCGTTVKNLHACAVSVGNMKGKDSTSARITFRRPTR
ncbi:MAG: neocarzinostatin apoprotein domain-containing protein [Acidimicrobiales bacterium]